MRTRAGLAVGCLLLALVSTSGAAEKPPSSLFTPIEELEARARAERADFFSPGHFAAGERELGESRRELEQGRSANDIKKRLERAEAAFRQALANVAAAREILGPSLAARDSALAAGAPRHAAEVFARGDRWLRDAGLAVERGDTREAVIKAADAERRFREAEELAIKETVIGEARRLIAQAEAEKAGVWAPQSLGRARDLLARAERQLGEDRTRQSEPRVLAAESAAAANQALAITARARAAGEHPAALEAAILEAEAQLQAIAAALGQRLPDAATGFAARTAAIAAAIAALQAENDSLSAEIASVAAEIEKGRARERALAAELSAGREREERLRRLRNLFTPDEATIHRQGRQLILRLKGLAFLPAKSELLPGNEALLSKVVAALRELPGASLTIEGHTDSQGDEKQNLALSEERAQAVRAYLEANLNLSDRLVSAVGHGEGYPIASNDNEAGRAQNRRIDLVFDAPNLTGE